MTLDYFAKRMALYGWAVLPSVVSDAMIQRMRDGLDAARVACRFIQVKNGVSGPTLGTVHHLPAIERAFVDFLDENPAAAYIERFFGGKYVLNSFGGNFNVRSEDNYAAVVHRDVRTYQNEALLLNTLVMLDDFTEENGATWLLSGGHRMKEKPEPWEFTKGAVQAIAPSGSILLFDSNLWHAAGENRTDQPRRSVTPMFCKPWIKPGFDYCRALGADTIGISDNLRQVIGYNARIPASLDEWYRRPEERFYKGDQG